MAQRTTCSSQGHLSDGPNLELGLNQTGCRWWPGFPGWVLGVEHQPRSVGPWSFRVVTGYPGPCGLRVCVRCLCSIKSNKFQPPQDCHPSQRESRPSISPISPGQNYLVPLTLPVDTDLPVMSRVRASVLCPGSELQWEAAPISVGSSIRGVPDLRWMPSDLGQGVYLHSFPPSDPALCGLLEALDL